MSSAVLMPRGMAAFPQDFAEKVRRQIWQVISSGTEFVFNVNQQIK